MTTTNVLSHEVHAGTEGVFADAGTGH